QRLETVTGGDDLTALALEQGFGGATDGLGVIDHHDPQAAQFPVRGRVVCHYPGSPCARRFIVRRRCDAVLYPSTATDCQVRPHAPEQAGEGPRRRKPRAWSAARRQTQGRRVHPRGMTPDRLPSQPPPHPCPAPCPWTSSW